MAQRRRIQEDLQECKMEVGGSEEGEVVTLESDDSEPEEVMIPEPLSKRTGGKLTLNPRAQPMFVDLTNDVESEDDDVMITDSAGNKTADDGDMPELIEIDAVPRQSKEEEAEEFKKKGNDHFKRGEYYQALDMYGNAIKAMPEEASYYGNRSACYMMLKQYKNALIDIKSSLQLDPTYGKGYLRLIRTTLALGSIKECEIAFEAIHRNNLTVEQVDTEHERLKWLKKQMADIATTQAKKDYRKLVFLTSQALDLATASNELKMMKADALIRCGRHIEAQEICTEVLQNDARCPEAYYIRALCLYLDDNLDKGIQYLRQGLQFAPDNSLCQNLFKKLKSLKDRRDTAGAKFLAHRYDEAKVDYVHCLSLVTEGDVSNNTIQSKLQFNLALIASKQNKLDESLESCGKAIELNPKYIKALIHRAKIYTLKEMHDDAVHDYEAVLRIDPSLGQQKKDLQNAKLAAKKAKRKDYYKILNIEKNATDDEIRKAYKKRALVHHPDRHANATEAVQKEQERLFKDLGEAYEVLSDPKKRFRYDQGADLMDERGGGFDSGFENSDFINLFFSNSGVPQFRPSQSAGGAGGGRGSNFHYTYRH